VVPQVPVAASSRRVLYTSRRGDTLVTISDRFGVSLDELRRWNKMTGIKVEAGRRLHVSEPASAPGATSGHRRTVSEGSAKAHEQASRKGSTQQGAVHGGAKKNEATTGKKQPAQGSRTRSGTAKSRASSTHRHEGEKPAAKSKSSKSKQN
jgi:membrane-bound lytic murein transglycosylase D